MTEDATFSDVSAYGSEWWVAARLGKTRNWLRDARPELEQNGFPKRDPLTNYSLKADVDAWLARRRRIADLAPTIHHPTTPSQINYDAV